MRELPRGTVTFLFTDIEGSTRLLKQLGEGYGDVLRDHQRLLREAVEELGGQVIDTQGDSFFIAFARAKDAVGGAVAAQRALAQHEWPRSAKVRVRMGLHSGEPAIGDDRYVGMGVHKAARIASAAHGGQTLVSRATRELVEDELPERVRLIDLGQHQLKDFERPEQIFQVNAPGLAQRFPPLRTDAPLPTARPWQRRVGVSRQRAVIAAASALIVAGVVIGLALAMGRHESNVDNQTSGTRAAGSFTAPGKDPSEIRIGRSIGAVALGMPEAVVKSRYGPGIPGQWHKLGRGGDRIIYPGEGGALTVSFYGDKVAQVATTSSYYSTDNGVHPGVTAPVPVDPASRERALARHELEEVRPGVYAWKDFVFDEESFSYCLRDDRSATQLAFASAVSTHIKVVSITDARFLAYLPVIVMPFPGQTDELYCRAAPVQP
jgi:class 3 adenylate cyclase